MDKNKYGYKIMKMETEILKLIKQGIKYENI